MTLRIGLIGTGGFSKVHANILAKLEGVEVAAFTGTSLEKAEKAASPYGARAYDQVETMLEEQKLDAVYICVPPMAHGAIEDRLIERGIPFLVEKPLSVDIDTPERIAARIRDTSLLTSVGYHFRYTDAVTQAKQWLEGKTCGMALGYWMGTMPGVAWWRKQDQSGGQFVEQTTHIVDMLRYVVGEVDEVYAAFDQRAMHKKHEGVTVPDVGTVTLKLTGGGIATLSNTCLLPMGDQVGLTLYTPDGVAVIDDEQLVIKQPGVTTATKNRSSHYVLENEAFIHALLTGDASGIRSTYEDALKTQRITSAALASAQSGLPVKL